MGILITRRKVFAGCAALGATHLVGVAHGAEPLVVVVSNDVAQRSFSSSELAAIFTTRRRNYDNGQRVIPLNLPPRHDSRMSFDSKVLGMGPDEVARYWIDRKVRGGNSPPRHVPSAALLARLIEKLPGSIGYLPESMAGGLLIVGRP